MDEGNVVLGTIGSPRFELHVGGQSAAALHSFANLLLAVGNPVAPMKCLLNLGMTTVSMVPGSIVDRNTHSSGRHFGDRCRTAVPISSETEETYDSFERAILTARSSDARDSTSASPGALPSVVAAVRRFSVRTFAKASSTPGFLHWRMTPVSESTFCGFASMPITVAPLRNMQAATVTPTCPSLQTTIFMENVLGSVQARSLLWCKLQQSSPALVHPRSTKSPRPNHRGPIHRDPVKGV
jgi:hypothetical protein